MLSSFAGCRKPQKKKKDRKKRENSIKIFPIYAVKSSFLGGDMKILGVESSWTPKGYNLFGCSVDTETGQTGYLTLSEAMPHARRSWIGLRRLRQVAC